jgi:hypothetical protein
MKQNAMHQPWCGKTIQVVHANVSVPVSGVTNASDQVMHGLTYAEIDATGSPKGIPQLN